MGSESPLLPPEVEHYVSEVITRESSVAHRLREETQKLPSAQMQTTSDQMAFFAMLLRLIDAKRVIEVGTFTGYGSLSMALALPPHGKVIACDTSREWTDIAKRYWREAGVMEKIDLHLAPAKNTLSELLDKGMAETIDFVFIDADKGNYDIYYELCLKLVRPGGLIAFDNMLWSGAVANNIAQDKDTNALRALNLKLRDDKRVEACLLTVADGIALVKKI